MAQSSSYFPRVMRQTDARPRLWPWLSAAIVGLLLSGGWVDQTRAPASNPEADEFWRVGKPAPIAVAKGRAIFRAPARTQGSEIMVIVSALSRERGPYSIELTTKAVVGATLPSIVNDGPLAAQKPIRESVRPCHAADGELFDRDAAPAQEPARKRVFHMLVRDGDAYSPSNYVAIPATLRGLGTRIQVYVAVEDLGSVHAETVKDIIRSFDDRIYPMMSSRFGPALDVDGDGRFTILISNWLEHLGGGRYAVDGFVRVADLDRAFQSPLGNQCDMMYLSTSLQSGPYLRTVLAHEYMHAVLAGRKGRHGQPGGPPQEEEGWLDEAIAHLAEDRCGFSTSNIDYRVRAFLAGPERYQLVVEDYFAADLFRSHGNRGSTYLFLKWCDRQYGPELLPALVHSNLRGTSNLEECTGSTFAALFRQWTLDLIKDDLEADATTQWLPARCSPDRDGPHHDKMPSQPRDSEPAGPRFTRVSAGSVDRWMALGTTSHYAIVDGSASGAIEIEVAGPAEADLQVTAIPLGDGRPRIDLAAVKVRGVEGKHFLRAQIKERHGAPVRLSQFSWEPISPGANARTDAASRGRLKADELEKTMGTSALAASGELTSQLILLPDTGTGHGPFVVKIVGVDGSGRRISAWADLDPAGPSH